MADLGQFALVLALFLAGYGVLADGLGLLRKQRMLLHSGRNALAASWLCLSVAVVMLLIAMVQCDFSLKYVYENCSRDLPFAYRISALWAGSAGSLLFWLWLQSSMAGWVFCRGNASGENFAALARLGCQVVSVFFLVAMIFDRNPFEVAAAAQADGIGLNPLLQHPAMVLHPPLLFMGYAGYIVPCAWALAALAFKDHPAGTPYFSQSRNWMLWAWIYLSIGIALGAWWAYEELGWGGFWAWDPVENASLMPWFTGTALLHCYNRYKPGSALAKWLIVMCVVTYCLCVFGTFLTRYGLVSSVHAFPDPGLGILFFYLIILIGLVTAILFWRKRRHEPAWGKAEALRGDWIKTTTNWLLVLLMFLVFVGTLFPFFSGLVSQNKITLQPEYFTRITGPFGLFLLLLVGICPHLLSFRLARHWRTIGAATVLAVSIGLWAVTRALTLPCLIISGFVGLNLLADLFWPDEWARLKQMGGSRFRKPLRWYGARLSHLGVVLIFCGFAGAGGYDTEEKVALHPKESTTVGNFTIQLEALTMDHADGKITRTAHLAVSRQTKSLRMFSPSLVWHQRRDQTTSEVDVHRSLAGDLYLALLAVDQQKQLINLRVLIKPLINWMWAGCIIMVGGAGLVLLSWYVNKPPVAVSVKPQKIKGT